MTSIFQTVLLFGGVIALLYVAGHIDQWVQRFRGVEPNANGRIQDGIIAKFTLGLVICGFLVAFIFWGGSEHAVDGCYGSMRC